MLRESNFVSTIFARHLLTRHENEAVVKAEQTTGFTILYVAGQPAFRSSNATKKDIKNILSLCVYCRFFNILNSDQSVKSSQSVMRGRDETNTLASLHS